MGPIVLSSFELPPELGADAAGCSHARTLSVLLPREWAPVSARGVPDVRLRPSAAASVCQRAVPKHRRPRGLKPQKFILSRLTGRESEIQAWAGPAPPGAALPGGWTPSSPRVLTRASPCVSVSQSLLTRTPVRLEQAHPPDLTLPALPL